jgi:hypothetical protein
MSDLSPPPLSSKERDTVRGTEDFEPGLENIIMASFDKNFAVEEFWGKGNVFFIWRHSPC